MFDAGKGDIFLGLLTPHGLIELTAVFLAAAVGHAAGLVGDLTGQPPARPGARRAGQGGDLRRRRPGRGAAGRGADRGPRHAVAAADVRADRASGWSPRSLSWPTSFTSAARPSRRARPATSTMRPTSSRPADLQPAGGLHRQVVVGQRRAPAPPAVRRRRRPRGGAAAMRSSRRSLRARSAAAASYTCAASARPAASRSTRGSATAASST